MVDQAACTSFARTVRTAVNVHATVHAVAEDTDAAPPARRERVNGALERVELVCFSIEHHGERTRILVPRPRRSLAAALCNACHLEAPAPGTVFHSDCGSQYFSDEFRAAKARCAWWPACAAKETAGSVNIVTYDTEVAARAVVPLAVRLAADGTTVQAVRLDRGNLGEHARQVRPILDAGALIEVGIFASGNLDEYTIADLIASGAPMNGYGVGTRITTSADRPHLDCVYKLQEYAGTPQQTLRGQGRLARPQAGVPTG